MNRLEASVSRDTVTDDLRIMPSIGSKDNASKNIETPWLAPNSTNQYNRR